MKTFTPLARFTILMDSTAVRKLKLLALDERCSASSLARAALKNYLNRHGNRRSEHTEDEESNG